MKHTPGDRALLYKERQVQKILLIADVISGMLLILFLYTAISKLSDNQTFLFSLRRAPILAAHASFIAIALPLTELLIAALLFIPSTRPKGIFVAAATLIVFTAYLIYILLFSSNLPCSCGGVISTLSWRQHIFFNLFFIMLSITGIYLYKKNKTFRSEVPP